MQQQKKKRQELTVEKIQLQLMKLILSFCGCVVLWALWVLLLLVLGVWEADSSQSGTEHNLFVLVEKFFFEKFFLLITTTQQL